MFLKMLSATMDHVGFHKPADRQVLVAVLSECLAHTRRSTDGLDAGLGTTEIAKSLQRAVVRLEKGKRIDRLQLELLFAPTGDLQETSIDNGWDDEFLELSARFDRAI